MENRTLSRHHPAPGSLAGLLAGCTEPREVEAVRGLSCLGQ